MSFKKNIVSKIILLLEALPQIEAEWFLEWLERN